MLAPPDPRCGVVQFQSLLTDADFARLAAFLTRIPTLGHALVLLGSRRKDDAVREVLPFLAPDQFHFEFR